MKRSATLTDILTDEEIQRALDLYAECRPGAFNAAVVKEIVEPAIDRIDEMIGQQNDPKFIGYLIEHFLIKMKNDPSAPQGPR